MKAVNILLFLYCLIHLVYQAFGVLFDTSPIFLFWQVLDITLLKERLLESLLFLHSQPPLFNAFIGTILKIFPQHYEYCFSIVYHLTGFLIVYNIYLITYRLTLKFWISIFTATVFLISPAFILFEYWSGYSWFIILFLLLAVNLFYNYLHSGSNSKLLCFFSIIAALCLLTPQFHLLYFILVFCLVLYFTLGTTKKIVLLKYASLPFLIVFAVYLKNYILFDNFAASSWFGMNIAHNLYGQLNEEEKEFLLNNNLINKLSVIPPFSEIDQYASLDLEDEKYKSKFYDIPVLNKEYRVFPEDAPIDALRSNLNNIRYIPISKAYLKDSLKIIKIFPKKYIQRTEGGVRRFLSPAWFKTMSIENKEKLSPLLIFLEKYFFLKIEMNKESPVFIVPTIFTFLSFALSLALLINPKIKFQDDKNRAVVSYILTTILYLTLLSTFLESGENARFRFTIEPFLLVMFVVGISRMNFNSKSY